MAGGCKGGDSYLQTCLFDPGGPACYERASATWSAQPRSIVRSGFALLQMNNVVRITHNGEFNGSNCKVRPHGKARK